MRECSSGECVYKSGNDCEETEDCSSGCDRCIDCKCTEICDPDYCESCISDSCKVCGGDTNKACCDGDCYNTTTQKCCDGSDPCDTDYICDSDETCCDGDCCEELCCHCFDNTCIDNCSFCYWPRFCDGCNCVECNLEYHSDCDTSHNEDWECPGCTIQTLYPCSTFYTRVYTGNSSIDCTGSGCADPTHPVCYTQYDCTVAQIWPLYICSDDESGPMGLKCKAAGNNPLCTECGQAAGGGEPETSTQENCRDENPPPGWC